MGRPRKKKDVYSSEPLICDAQIQRFNFFGCGAVLNESNTAAVNSGKRKIRICSRCERRLKHENLLLMDLIEKLIYGATYSSRTKS